MPKYYNNYDLSPIIKDKQNYLSTHIRFMLNRSIAMFEYGNLPPTISQFQLEQVMQTAGAVTVFSEGGNVYALNGALGGECDVEGRPTQSTVVCPALKLSKTFTIGKDCVVIDNDVQRLGLLPIFKWYGSMLCEGGITVYNSLVLERAKTFMSASDDKTLKSATLFIKSLERGDLSVIGESAFFEGVKSFSSSITTNNFKSLIEIMQYLKACELNDIGLNANWNAKREALGANETALNDDYLYPFIDVMMRCRKAGLKAVNDMFGLNIIVELSSSWEQTQFEKRGILPNDEQSDNDQLDNEQMSNDQLDNEQTNNDQLDNEQEKTADNTALNMEDYIVQLSDEVKEYLNEAVKRAISEAMKAKAEQPAAEQPASEGMSNGQDAS